MRMKHAPVASRRRVNLLLDDEIVGEARALGLNLSQVASRALAIEVKKERDRRWAEENRAAMEASNRWLEEHGLPYAELRLW